MALEEYSNERLKVTHISTASKSFGYVLLECICTLLSDGHTSVL
jgi:hypothetical protein